MQGKAEDRGRKGGWEEVIQRVGRVGVRDR